MHSREQWAVLSRSDEQFWFGYQLACAIDGRYRFETSRPRPAEWLHEKTGPAWLFAWHSCHDYGSHVVAVFIQWLVGWHDRDEQSADGDNEFEYNGGCMFTSNVPD
jgi:hypothetical protein